MDPAQPPEERGKSNQSSTPHRSELPVPPATFPDNATCRVKLAGFSDYFDCLSHWAFQCPYALNLAKDYFCRHPSGPEILARSQKQQPD